MWRFMFVILYLFVEALGVPLASEVIFFVLGGMIVSGDVALPAAFIGAWTATCAGNLVGYLIFYRYGTSLLDRMGQRWPKFAAKRQQLQPKFLANWVQITTVTRFLGLGSPQLVLWLAGSMRVPPMRFLPYLFTLNVAWVAYWIVLNRWLARFIMPYWHGLETAQKVIAALLGLGLLWVIHKGTQWISARIGVWRMGRKAGKG
jgi:membrane protein DedA with SNARE-associated domain